jgi:hypothetical protein
MPHTEYLLKRSENVTHHTIDLESIIKQIYPSLNFDILFFTFHQKFVLDILWLPRTPIGIQYAQMCLK